MRPGRRNLRIIQGATFRQSVRWGQPTVHAVLIAGISAAAPAVISTVAPHGLPTIPWPVGVRAPRHGLGDEVLLATASGPNTATVPVSTLTAVPFKGPGELRFNPPVDLTGYTARLQIRASAASPVVLLELTSENGGIEIDPEGLVILNLSASQTAAIRWASAEYDLELMDAGGFVTRLIEGAVSVSPEITREPAL